MGCGKTFAPPLAGGDRGGGCVNQYCNPKLERAGFLKECLPSVLRAVGIYGGDCEVLLIDNGSSDGSAEYVRGNFPLVKILSLGENFSFTKAMNKGLGRPKGIWLLP